MPSGGIEPPLKETAKSELNKVRRRGLAATRTSQSHVLHGRQAMQGVGLILFTCFTVWCLGPGFRVGLPGCAFKFIAMCNETLHSTPLRPTLLPKFPKPLTFKPLNVYKPKAL